MAARTQKGMVAKKEQLAVKKEELAAKRPGGDDDQRKRTHALMAEQRNILIAKKQEERNAALDEFKKVSEAGVRNVYVYVHLCFFTHRLITPYCFAEWQRSVPPRGCGGGGV